MKKIIALAALIFALAGCASAVNQLVAGPSVAGCVTTAPSLDELSHLTYEPGALSTLASCLNIPSQNVKAFEKAVRASAIAWQAADGFAAQATRDYWAFSTLTLITTSGQKEPSLTQLTGEYR